MDNKINKTFGLIGKDIAYSFSRSYFSDKFKKLNLKTHSYINFDIKSIGKFPDILSKPHTIKGFNVTIPYKEAIIPFLDSLDAKAKAIGAVNTIQFTKQGTLKGYNTDVIGFKKSIMPLLKPQHKAALILGTGGASKAIAYALTLEGIAFKFVSRTPKNAQQIAYTDLDKTVIETHTIIINSTPLGTHPKTEESPDIPYQYITKNHVLFDLIYNPEETLFLSKGKQNGATIKNGYQMLQIQAEEAWRIWNE